jgi:hypothetical protein
MEQQVNTIIKRLDEINKSLNTFDPQWIIVCVSIVTLAVLILYTYYTYKIARATKETMTENLRPIISCHIKSGINHYGEQDVYLRPELKDDTRCIVINHSKYNVEVFVNLNLRLDGCSKEYCYEYAAKKGWPVSSFQKINGHFNLAQKYDLTNVENIVVDLEVSYKSDTGKMYKNPVQHWHLDKHSGIWINDIGLVT